ncbi:hypothetical protein KA068_02610 [Candidatus Saccharibacteria bacterium]|nr:hypothetical protein [Candidatus Saccharibacteria bacterium]
MIEVTTPFTNQETKKLEVSLRERMPFYSERIQPGDIEVQAKYAVISCIDAHNELYQSFYERGSREVGRFGDEFSGEDDKYISWLIADRLAFGQWKEGNPATDVGIRGINPEFDGSANQTTVIHANSAWSKLFRNAPISTQRALEGVYDVARDVRNRLVLPYLAAIATIHGINEGEYVSHFFRDGITECSIARAILYHAVDTKVPQLAIVGNDGADLSIKEHCDQGAFTADIWTSGPGLQYLSPSGEWRNTEDTGIAIFPGAGEKHLGIESDLAGIVHRVVSIDKPGDLPSNSKQRPLKRIALPYFISSLEDNVDPVMPSSAATHPTSYEHALCNA